MQALKLQIEIRFTPILDFSSAYKTILSPYLKLANFSIQNFGAPEESCILTFKDEPNIRIDARWDRLIYILNTNEKTAFDATSPIMYFFEIYDKLKSLNSYGTLNDFLLATWHIEKKESFTANSVTEKWLKKTPKISEFDLDDIAIVYEAKSKNNDVFKLQFGPFKVSDIKSFGLSPDELIKDDQKGLLIHSVFVKRKNEPSLQVLKKMYSSILETVSTNF